MADRIHVTPNVSVDKNFRKDEEGVAGGFIYVRPTQKDFIAYVDLQLDNDVLPVGIKIMHTGCKGRLRVLDDVDRPMTQIKCDCSKWLLRELDKLTDDALAEKFEFLVIPYEPWPVKIDRLIAPSGMSYTGTRDCTLGEAVHYYLGTFSDARKRGFRKAPRQ